MLASSSAYPHHPTWPPSLQHDSDLQAKTPRSLVAKSSYTATLPEITEDEDPFSHFLSPVLEEETTFDLDDLDEQPQCCYTAGISPSNKKDALFRIRLEEKWETFVARRLLSHRPTATSISAPLPPPFPQTPVLHHPSTPPNEDAMPDLSDDLPSPSSIGPGSPDSLPMSRWYSHSPVPDDVYASYDNYDDDDDDDDSDMDMDMDLDLDDDATMLDGWEADRAAADRAVAMAMAGRHARHRPRRCRFGGRNGSGKRRVWREPSPELWTVDEEEEEEEDEDEDEDEDEVEGEDGMRGLEGAGSRGRRGRKGKRKAKRVSWNEEVEVVEYER